MDKISKQTGKPEDIKSFCKSLGMTEEELREETIRLHELYEAEQKDLREQTIALYEADEKYDKELFENLTGMHNTLENDIKECIWDKTTNLNEALRNEREFLTQLYAKLSQVNSLASGIQIERYLKQTIATTSDSIRQITQHSVLIPDILKLIFTKLFRILQEIEKEKNLEYKQDEEYEQEENSDWDNIHIIGDAIERGYDGSNGITLELLNSGIKLTAPTLKEFLLKMLDLILQILNPEFTNEQIPQTSDK